MRSVASGKHAAERSLILLLLVAPWLWHFGSLAWNDRVLALRDAGNFYYPLFAWQCREWAAGRIPLWNPYDNLGTPSLADATSSVLYPGKLVFLLPFDYAMRFNLYVAGHVLLAAGTAYGVARRWRYGRPSAATAALGYAYGGPVLFQYCNVVYLVGAAWLPLAWWLGVSMLDERRPRRALGLGGVLAMMVVGGDPQAAYHVLLAVSVYAVARCLGTFWRRDGACGTPSLPSPGVMKIRGRCGGSDAAAVAHAESVPGSPPLPHPLARSVLRQWVADVARRLAQHIPGTRGPAPSDISSAQPSRVSAIRLGTVASLGQSPWGLLATAALTAGGLAAVQIVPTWEWSRWSDRVVFDKPRSVLEAISYLAGSGGDANPRRAVWPDVVHGLLGRPGAGTHEQHVYRYSVAPWRWLECVWPNVSGRTFPTCRRWLSALPAELEIWTPSLYGGLLPLMAIAAAWRWRRARGPQRAALVLLVGGMLASCGAYGLGWLAHEAAAGIPPLRPAVSRWGPAVGGLYWMLVVLLPGYVHFRYPAKWLVVAAWGMSLMAAEGVERLAAASRTADRKLPAGRRLLRLFGGGLLGTSLFSLTLAVLAWAMRPCWPQWFASAPASDIYGPFDASGAWHDVCRGLLHAAAVALLAAAAVWIRLSRRRLPLTVCLLLGTAAELAIAHSWLVATVPADLFRDPPAESEAGPSAELAGPVVPPRAAHGPRPFGPPASWQVHASTERLAEVVAWERRGLVHKHHLAYRVRVVDARSTLNSAAVDALLRLVPSTSGDDPDGLPASTHTWWQTLGVDRIVDSDGRGNITIRTLPGVMPAAWCVHHWKTAVPDPSRSRVSLAKALRRDWTTGDTGEPVDLRGSVVVDAGEPPLSTSGSDRTAEYVRIQRYEPQQVEMEAHLESPGLVVAADLFFPGWQVTSRTRDEGPVTARRLVQVQHVYRGVYLPAGTHRVMFRYRPWSFWLGGLGSLGSLAIVGLLWRRWPETSS